MTHINESIQKVFIDCLQSILRPIVRLTLFCGIGHSEFSAAARRVFIEVASEEYGVRGRIANVSRVSAVTGLPRKVISAHRSRTSGSAWTPDDEASPINTIIHYWRFDPKYCKAPGKALDLQEEGPGGFSELVSQYAGDIPASAIRKELIREKIVKVMSDGALALQREYSFPENLDQDFLRNAAFSISNHAETLVHNAKLVATGVASERDHLEFGWVERFAWSRRLSPQGIRDFQLWSRVEGGDLIRRAAEFISRREELDEDLTTERIPVSGLGVYFFGKD